MLLSRWSGRGRGERRRTRPSHHHEVLALTRARQQLRQRRPRPGVARLRFPGHPVVKAGFIGLAGLWTWQG